MPRWSSEIALITLNCSKNLIVEKYKFWALSIQPKRPVWNFQQLPVAKETAFPKISKKENNLARYTQIFEKIFTEVFVPFNFAPGISRIFDWMVRISQIKQFPECLETFREISLPFAAVSKFWKFWVNGKRPPSQRFRSRFQIPDRGSRCHVSFRSTSGDVRGDSAINVKATKWTGGSVSALL